jgi:MFS family permease
VTGGQLANLPPGYYTSISFIGTIAAFSLANMSNYAGYVMTFNLLGIINQDLGPDPNYVWIATGYVLAATTGALVWGSLSDIFGRRYFFIGGNAFALLGSILGAVAQNIVTLIFAQVFIGLALASQLSFSICVAELIPNKWRGYNNAVLFFMAIPFSTFGPIIARHFLSLNHTWRWSYYINLILTGLAIILATAFYHPPVFEQLHTKASKRRVLIELDYIGIVMFIAGMVLFLLGKLATQSAWTYTDRCRT